jgi:hypothetical protein
MTTIIAAMQDSLLTLESSKTGWKLHESLKGTSPQCVAFDPSNPIRAYCGTFGDGLWSTDDGGQTWDSIGEISISSKDVMSISVSHHHLKKEKIVESIQYMWELNLAPFTYLIMEVNFGKK